MKMHPATAAHITCLVILFISATRSEFFTALADLEYLITIEENVIEKLDFYVYKQREKLDMLAEALELYKSEHKQILKDKAAYLGNPVNSFALIKRLTWDLNTIETFIHFPPEYNRSPELKYPTKEDLDGAAEALGRLQTTYRLNVTQIANGLFNSPFGSNSDKLVYSIPLTISACYHIGRRLYDIGNYKNALDWIKVAHHKYDTGEQDYFMTPSMDIATLLSYTYIGLDDLINGLEWTKKLDAIMPSDFTRSTIQEFEKRLAEQELENEDEKMKRLNQQKRETFESLDDYNYITACRGQGFIPDSISKSLKCWYLKDGTFLKLAPVKMEQLYIKPDIYLIHQVLSDQEMEDIKNKAKPMLERAVVFGGENLESSSHRISKSAWFEEHELYNISRRTEDFTGLTMKTAEKFQVGTYGIAGYYAPHFDHHEKNSEDTPNQYKIFYGARLATVLFYLSDVAAGGATVFPDLGLTVFPVKGSALFWNNLLPSGNGDPKTMHAACPVLRGDKWVMTKWIHVAGQELRRPCLPEQQEDL